MKYLLAVLSILFFMSVAEAQPVTVKTLTINDFNHQFVFSFIRPAQYGGASLPTNSRIIDIIQTANHATIYFGTLWVDKNDTSKFFPENYTLEVYRTNSGKWFIPSTMQYLIK